MICSVESKLSGLGNVVAKRLSLCEGEHPFANIIWKPFAILA